MDTENHTIQKIEKKILHLILLAVLIILSLTLSLLALQFFKFIGEPEVLIFSDNSYEFSVMLILLIFLLCIYMIAHHRKQLNFTKELLKKKELSYRLSKDFKTLDTLLEVISSIHSQQKLSDILNTISRKIVECFQADHSTIMLVNHKSGMLKTEASFGKDIEFTKDALVPMGKSVAGWVAENAKPVLLNGEVDPVNFPGTQKKERNISSAMCVPLIIDQKSIGVLSVNLSKSKRTFLKSDLKLITIFAYNAAIAIQNTMLSQEKVKRIQLQAMAEQLHSPLVIKELVKNINVGNRQNKIREKIKMSILFADIRGFSSIVNFIEMEDVMHFLDAFYGIVYRAVSKDKGHIDKFIGDEAMAFFGAPNFLENSAVNCVNAAKDIVLSFKELKEEFSKRSWYFGQIGIGIGVNTGEVFFGNVGSKHRYDFTVIGNEVNIARRLCSQAKSDEILIAEKSIKEKNGFSSDFVGNVSFKGVPSPVSVYRVH